MTPGHSWAQSDPVSGGHWSTWKLFSFSFVCACVCVCVRVCVCPAEAWQSAHVSLTKTHNAGKFTWCASVWTLSMEGEMKALSLSSNQNTWSCPMQTHSCCESLSTDPKMSYNLGWTASKLVDTWWGRVRAPEFPGSTPWNHLLVSVFQPCSSISALVPSVMRSDQALTQVWFRIGSRSVHFSGGLAATLSSNIWPFPWGCALEATTPYLNTLPHLLAHKAKCSQGTEKSRCGTSWTHQGNNPAEYDADFQTADWIKAIFRFSIFYSVNKGPHLPIPSRLYNFTSCKSQRKISQDFVCKQCVLLKGDTTIWTGPGHLLHLSFLGDLFCPFSHCQPTFMALFTKNTIKMVGIVTALRGTIVTVVHGMSSSGYKSRNNAVMQITLREIQQHPVQNALRNNWTVNAVLPSLCFPGKFLSDFFTVMTVAMCIPGKLIASNNWQITSNQIRLTNKMELFRLNSGTQNFTDMLPMTNFVISVNSKEIKNDNPVQFLAISNV